MNKFLQGEKLIAESIDALENSLGAIQEIDKVCCLSQKLHSERTADMQERNRRV